VLEQAGWSVLLLWMYATAGIINIHAPKKYGCVIADLYNKLLTVEFLKHLMNCWAESNNFSTNSIAKKT
jgi:hypothetical protein